MVSEGVNVALSIKQAGHHCLSLKRSMDDNDRNKAIVSHA
jgi:hypothetical protein